MFNDKNWWREGYLERRQQTCGCSWNINIIWNGCRCFLLYIFPKRNPLLGESIGNILYNMIQLSIYIYVLRLPCSRIQDKTTNLNRWYFFCTLEHTKWSVFPTLTRPGKRLQKSYGEKSTHFSMGKSTNFLWSHPMESTGRVYQVRWRRKGGRLLPGRPASDVTLQRNVWKLVRTFKIDVLFQ